MLKNFVNQIKKGSKIAIYGAGTVGIGLKHYIEQNRPDIKIVFFVDAFVSGEREGLEIKSFKELESVRDFFDLLVVSTRRSAHELIAIFNYFDIKFIMISNEIDAYFRRQPEPEQLQEEYKKINDVLKILKTNEDKKLYKAVWNIWLKNDLKNIQKYASKKHNIEITGLQRNYLKHYQEFIVPDAIETVIDAGVCNGTQFFVFKKNFKNLKKIYGFEPLYDEVKNPNYDYYFQQMKEVEIVRLGLWNKEEEITFVETLNRNLGGSFVKDSENNANRKIQSDDNIIKIKTTTIDEFKQQKGITKIDYIKMDVEGAEMQALKGGEKTLIKDRPQLAISIYHSASDLVNIPLYLNSILKSYTFHIGHYSPKSYETVLYAIPNELL